MRLMKKHSFGFRWYCCFMLSVTILFYHKIEKCLLIIRIMLKCGGIWHLAFTSANIMRAHIIMRFVSVFALLHNGRRYHAKWRRRCDLYEFGDTRLKKEGQSYVNTWRNYSASQLASKKLDLVKPGRLIRTCCFAYNRWSIVDSGFAPVQRQQKNVGATERGNNANKKDKRCEKSLQQEMWFQSHNHRTINSIRKSVYSDGYRAATFQ